MQEARVPSLVREDPTCHHSYSACALEPRNRLQLLGPRALAPVLRNKRSHRNRSLCTAPKRKPRFPQLEKSLHSSEDPAQPKRNTSFFKKMAVLPTSDSPWFTDLAFQVCMQYCSLQHRTLLSPPDTSTAEPQEEVPALAQPLNSFWSYFSALLQQHLGHVPTWGLIFWCPIFFPFHTVHGVLKARILEWFAIHFSSGLLCQISPPWPFTLGGLHSS